MDNYHFPVAFFDPPVVLDCSSTNIPGSGSATLQVIADLGANAATKLLFIDTTGNYIGVYIGTVGNEILRCIIGGGLDSDALSLFPKHCRVSVRSMTASAITSGQLTCTFLSY